MRLLNPRFVKAKEACDVIRRGDSHIKKNAPVEPQLSFVIVASGTPCAMPLMQPFRQIMSSIQLPSWRWVFFIGLRLVFL